jgi:hypothetical protein
MVKYSKKRSGRKKRYSKRRYNKSKRRYSKRRYSKRRYSKKRQRGGTVERRASFDAGLVPTPIEEKRPTLYAKVMSDMGELGDHELIKQQNLKREIALLEAQIEKKEKDGSADATSKFGRATQGAARKTHAMRAKTSQRGTKLQKLKTDLRNKRGKLYRMEQERKGNSVYEGPGPPARRYSLPTNEGGLTHSQMIASEYPPPPPPPQSHVLENLATPPEYSVIKKTGVAGGMDYKEI